MDVEYVSNYFNKNYEKEMKRNHQNEYAVFTYDLQRKYLNAYLGSGNQIVLDAGCGSGDYAVDIVKWGNDIHLIDLSEKLLQNAVSTIRANQMDGHLKSWKVGDICKLTYLPDESMDVVICMGGVINFLADNVEAALCEFNRVLKDNGILIVGAGSKYGAMKSMLNNGKNAISYIIKLIDEDLLKTGLVKMEFSDIPMRKLYSVDEFKLLLQRYWFHPVEIRAIPSVFSGLYTLLEHVSQKDSYQVLLRLEESVSDTKGLLDCGDFYLVFAEKHSGDMSRTF